MALLHLLTPAKINLCLSVGAPLPGGSTDRFGEGSGGRGGPRDVSGYHPIASWFAPIRLFDDVVLERLPEGSASVFEVAWQDGAGTRPVEWPIDRDLTVRAHALMERAVGRRLPVRVSVIKSIPAGGGLAGGSTDAAAVLMGLAGMFDLAVDAATLAEWSMRIGSDIAYFVDERVLARVRESAAVVRAGRDWIEELSPRAALVCGLGELVERAGAVRTDVTLFLPSFGCPTGAVYRAYDRTAGAVDAARVRGVMDRAAREGRIDPVWLFNDLTRAAMHAAPELGRVMEALSIAAEAPVHMSGSGSTLFMVGWPEGPRDGAVREAADRLGVRCVRTRTCA